MPYKLYIDRQEDFTCEVAVKNASLKNAFARMIVECGDLTLMFRGQLKDGKCIVPIRKLKGLLEENSKGKMHLEVIVEDTYFSPWKEDFIVEEYTSVNVKIEEQKHNSKKPVLEVKNINHNKISPPTAELLYICEKVGIRKNNVDKKLSDFKQVVKEYFKSSPEFARDSKKYIREAVMALK